MERNAHIRWKTCKDAFFDGCVWGDYWGEDHRGEDNWGEDHR